MPFFAPARKPGAQKARDRWNLMRRHDCSQRAPLPLAGKGVRTGDARRRPACIVPSRILSYFRG
jgi:hypothetical protein